MTEIHLDGVALRTHDDPYLFDHDPYAHQTRLANLVREASAFVAVNDSPTGGGKTESWLAPALENRLNTVAVYPTNALVADQYDALAEKARSAVDHDVSVLHVTSDTLHAQREQRGVRSNGKALDMWLQTERNEGSQRVLLTNPDIFVMLCRDLYANPNREFKRFELAVVDEFHRAGRKQRNTLCYLLDELCERPESEAWLRRVVFLSATPDDGQERRFVDAMSPPYHRVTTDGDDERRSFSGSPGEAWRPVMPPVDLEVRTAPTFGTADAILEELEETRAFCRERRTVVMVDGVHEVERVSRRLRSELDRQVERIDGFHGGEKRRKLREFDVLVSNSAVEVGVDFDVDRVLFAGHDASTFLQRLGRLRGKHRQRRRARCYVPPSVEAAFAEHDGGHLTRTELRTFLKDTFPDPTDPQTFDWRYSAPEALDHVERRVKSSPPDKRERVERAGFERLTRHFLEQAPERYGQEDVVRTKEAIDIAVLSNLRWYRGDSIQALVYDRTREAVTTYNVFYLLRHGDVEFFDQDTFRRIVPPELASRVDRYSRYVDGFCTFDGTIETDEGYGRDVYLTGATLNGWLRRETQTREPPSPAVLPGMKVQVSPGDGGSRVPSVDVMNQRLNSRRERLPGDDGGILCYAVPGNRSMVKEQYDLGPFFFLYPVGIDTERSYSLAIGTDALYLHCHAQDRHERDDGGLVGID